MFKQITRRNYKMDIEKKIFDILINAKIYDNRIFIHQNINKDKAINAINVYNKFYKKNRISIEDILIQIDDTIFGSAKDGLLFTREGLFTRMSFCTPLHLSIRECTNLTLQERKILLSNTKIADLALPEKDNIQKVYKLIVEIASLLVNGEQSVTVLDKNLNSEDININNNATPTQNQKSNKIDADEELAKQIFNNTKYYFYYGLHKNILAQHRINALSNTLDINIDQFFAISQEQMNDAWRRNSNIENSIEKEFAQATHAILSLALAFPKIVYKNSKSKPLTALSQNDYVINEIIILIFLESLQLFHREINDEQTLHLVIDMIEEIIFKRLLLQFFSYESKQNSNANSLRNLNVSGNNSDLLMKMIKFRSVFLKSLTGLAHSPYSRIIKGAMIRHSFTPTDSDELFDNTNIVEPYKNIADKYDEVIDNSIEEYGNYLSSNLEQTLMQILR